MKQLVSNKQAKKIAKETKRIVQEAALEAEKVTGITFEQFKEWYNKK